MKPWLLVPLTWLAFAPAGILLSDEMSSQPVGPSVLDAGQGDNTGARVSDLDYRSDCPPPYGQQPRVFAPRLCNGGEGRIDPLVHRLLSRLLGAGMRDKETLCVIDSAIVNSQRDCLPVEPNFDASFLADLMRRLAWNWRQQGSLERAEQLLRRASAILADADPNGMMRLSTLQAWALLEIDRGKLSHAREIAEQLTALARKEYHRAPMSSSSLVRALELESAVLAKLGFAGESRAALQEAEALAALPDPCEGIVNCECKRDDTDMIVCEEGEIPFFQCRQDESAETACERVR